MIEVKGGFIVQNDEDGPEQRVYVGSIRRTCYTPPEYRGNYRAEMTLYFGPSDDDGWTLFGEDAEWFRGWLQRRLDEVEAEHAKMKLADESAMVVMNRMARVWGEP